MSELSRYHQHWQDRAQRLCRRLAADTRALFEQPSVLSQPTKLAYLLLAEAIWSCRRSAGPLLVGIGGGQGAGKSTLVQFVAALLAAEKNLRVQTLSLDDFYLSQAHRQQRASNLHPLFATRGVPGTHDMDRLFATLNGIRAGARPALPQFDKARDNPLPANRWPRAAGPLDVILLEGWCVGAEPIPAEQLRDPVNQLELEQDRDGSWRREINRRLASDYGALFDSLDLLVYLQVPGIDAVCEWRNRQEQLLRDHPQPGRAVLSPAQVVEFVQYFERLTLWMQRELPTRADLVIALAPNHDARDFYRNAT